MEKLKPDWPLGKSRSYILGSLYFIFFIYYKYHSFIYKFLNTVILKKNQFSLHSSLPHRVTTRSEVPCGTRLSHSCTFPHFFLCLEHPPSMPFHTSPCSRLAWCTPVCFSKPGSLCALGWTWPPFPGEHGEPSAYQALIGPIDAAHLYPFSAVSSLSPRSLLRGCCSPHTRLCHLELFTSLGLHVFCFKMRIPCALKVPGALRSHVVRGAGAALALQRGNQPPPDRSPCSKLGFCPWKEGNLSNTLLNNI